MDQVRRNEIMEAVFRTVWDRIVIVHVTPAQESPRGFLLREIQSLAQDSNVPLEDLVAFLREGYLNEVSMDILMREAPRFPFL